MISKVQPTQNHAKLTKSLDRDAQFYHHVGLTPQFSGTCKGRSSSLKNLKTSKEKKKVLNCFPDLGSRKRIGEFQKFKDFNIYPIQNIELFKLVKLLELGFKG